MAYSSRFALILTELDEIQQRLAALEQGGAAPGADLDAEFEEVIARDTARHTPTVGPAPPNDPDL